jgi:hypothetical protein
MNESEYRQLQLDLMTRIAAALERMTALYERKIVLVKEPHQVEEPAPRGSTSVWATPAGAKGKGKKDG